MEDSPEVEAPPRQRRFDIFGQITTEKVFLPDEVSYVEITKLSEGGRREFLKKTERPMKVNREGEATVTVDQAAQRTALLETCIIGWDLEVDGEPYVFAAHTLRRFLKDAPVDVIDDIEKACRDLNPWLRDEVTVEELDAQIAELTELRDEKLAEEEGKAG